MKLRPYQKEAVDVVISKYNAGITRQLVVLPTGSGKTIIMAFILKKFKDKRVLIVSHRMEIVRQTISAMSTILGSDVGSYCGSSKFLSSDIVVGTIQTCCRPKTLSILEKEKFDILIIDEAHHSASNTYRRLIGGILPSILLGFTATPNLANGNTLGEIYQEISYSKKVENLIAENYLSDVRGRKIRLNLNLGQVRLSSGDYLKASLARVINSTSINNSIVDKYRKYRLPKSKSVAFCVNIKHATDLSSAFNSGKIKSAFVHSKMSDYDRKNAIDSLRSGKIEVLTSVGILTEGFDMPSINTIIMARPTKSKSLYIQMVGRGLRNSKDKKICLVLDFADEKHTLNQQVSLDIVIPNSKYESRMINGDKCTVPWLEKPDSVTVLSISDEELKLLDIEIKKNKFDYSGLTDNERVRVRSRFAKLMLGEPLGVTPFGYKVVKKSGRRNTTVLTIKKKAEAVRFIFTQFAYSEDSAPTIALKVKEKFGFTISSGGVFGIISNAFYTGIIESAKYGTFVHKFERIVSAKLFSDAKKRKKLGVHGRAQATKNDFRFKSIIECVQCCGVFTGQMSKTGLCHYSCGSHKRKHKRLSIQESEIVDFLNNVYKSIYISKNNMKLVIDAFKKSDYFICDKRLPVKEKDFEFGLIGASMCINGSTLRAFIRIIFKNVKVYGRKLTYELNPPFDKMVKKQGSI